MSRSLVLCFLFLSSCASYRPFNPSSTQPDETPSVNLQQSWFFVSDLNGVSTEGENYKALLDQLEESGDKGTLIMLGNIAPGMIFPDSSHDEKRKKYYRNMESTVELVSEFGGTSYIVPGTNEWAKGRQKGLPSILRLQNYLEERLIREELFLPSGGCPGPVELQINEETVLVVIDTQWWFQSETGGEGSVCEIRDKGGFIVALSDVVKRNYNKHVIVAGFHPLYSNGPLSGYYHATKHLKPPIIGTIHALYKKLIGDPQDISNFSYRIFRTILRRTFEEHPNLIYLSAKEKSMQYFNRNDVHLVISGSMADATPVAHKAGPEYAYGRSGFTRIDQYENGEVWLAFINGNERLYQKKLYQWNPPQKEEVPENPNFSEQTITTHATKKHHRDKKRSGLLGINYRPEWEADIEGVEVFDISTEKSGLKIVKKGGGMQTRSLRLEDRTGRQWVLRSVEKYPSNTLPIAMRGSYIDDYVTDQVSASHPYGALVIPQMAEAVNVYHTNPRLVYLPDDPRLGIYRQDFANGLYLFEERPDDKVWQDADFFGNPEDIVSTSKLIEKMIDSGDDFPDQEHTIRSRLFDIVIGDWDRHDDQWRWAKFEDAEKYGEGIDLYRPIPRDRDQAFFLGDGALIELGSHKWGQPKFQGFKHRIRDVEGLAFNARYFDRYFMTEADWSIWEAQARHIQGNLTNEVIETAIKSWPKEIFDINGEKIISKLKQRRDDLPVYARQLYKFLSKEVDVFGTEKADRFVIDRINDGQVRVSIYRVKKDKREIKSKYYERTFDADITGEIRLYGFGGKDNFEFTGSADQAIRVRVIGGEGNDKITNDNATTSGKPVFLYDSRSGTEVGEGLKLRNRTTDLNQSINEYDRRSFKYNVLAPKLFGGFNPDDFILIGGGFSYTGHGFRKEPFKSRQTILFDVATKSSSFNFKLINEFNRVIGRWDFVTTIDVSEPSFADFFYGYGNGVMVNEGLREDDSQYYRARYSQIKVAPALRRRWNDDKHSFELSGLFHRINVETEDNDSRGTNRFIFNYDALRQTQGFTLLDEDRNFAGGIARYAFDNTNNHAVPTSGFRYDLTAKLMSQIGDESELNNTQYTTNLSFYFTIGRAERVTLASRIGSIVTTGKFEFYHAARLGGLHNLRGHRRLRFAGDNAIYQNNDIRIKLFDMRNKLFTGPFGINLIADFGRIWADGLPGEIGRDEWHRSVGGGLWVAPFNALVINLDYTKSLSLSGENGVPFVRFGYFF